MAVSGDGRVIAYASVVNETSKMRVKDLANNKSIEFKRDPYVNRPTLSPKGDRLAFVKRGTQLVLLDLWKDDLKDINDEANDQPFGSAGDMYPNYSPDGKQIVFTSRRDSDYEIYVINADGTGETRLTNSRGMDINARFSPDSRQIAFTSNRDGNYEVYVMNADGQNLRRITSHPERDDFPCWHPDGKHLVVVSERQGKFDLYQYDVPDR
jgi:TolB protein